MAKSLVIPMVLLGLFYSQPAQSCHGYKEFTKTDIALPEIIFEGRILDASQNKHHWEYTFEVIKVVKGELPQKTIIVGLEKDFARKTPETVIEFVNQYALYTRIALTTPQQIKKSCSRMEKKWVTYYEGDSLVTKYKDAPKCDSYLLPQSHQRASEIPFILNKTCGAAYIYDVEVFAKMQNYKENLEKYESIANDPEARKGVNMPELYKEMVGAPLPWDRPN